MLLIWSYINKLLYPNVENNSELDETPLRAAKAMIYMTNGFNVDPYDLCKDAIFESHNNNMVIITNFSSAAWDLC